MVGLPALFFDVDGSPSIMGILTQQTVTIDANGSAKSQMTLGLPLVFYDMEGLDALHHILPGTISTTEKKVIDLMDKEVLKHNTMEEDPIPWVPEWYDKQ